MGGAGDADILRHVDPILAEVVRVRGLVPKSPIRAGLHTRESLREVLLSEVTEEMSLEEIHNEEAVLRQLGVLPPDSDYYAMILDVLGSQIAGFYDDDSKELFLLDDLTADTQTPTMAHELFHGIQDQLYGIGRVRPDWERADDALIAAGALIEGDATGVMIDYALAGYGVSFSDIPNFAGLFESQMSTFEDMAAASMPEGVPAFLQAELLFPYFDGLHFVHYMKTAGGWEAVNQTYLDPPISSEQVIHPERYLDRDPPTWLEMDLAPLEAAGYRPVYDQVFGEFHWGALFDQTFAGGEVSERAIDDATEGWDGDRMLAWERPRGGLLLVELTVWDSPQDAREFEATARRWLEVRDGAPLAPLDEGPNGSLAAALGVRGWLAVERWGDMVLIVDGAAEDGGPNAEGVRDMAWRSRSRSAYRRPMPEPPPDGP